MWSQTQTSLLAPSPVLLAASFCAACRAMSMQRGLGTLKYRKPYGIHFKLRAQCRVENAEQSDISLVLRAWQIKMIEKGKWLAYKAGLPAAFPCSDNSAFVRYSVQADDQVCLQAQPSPSPCPCLGPPRIGLSFGRLAGAAGYRRNTAKFVMHCSRGPRKRQGTASFAYVAMALACSCWFTTAVMCCVSPQKLSKQFQSIRIL